MTKETQYEDVPIDSLYPHQKYFASKEKNKQVAPEVGGTAAVIAGSPIIAGKAIYSGGKSGLSAMGNNIASTLLEKMGELNKKDPSASFESPIVQQPPAPYSVWNEKLAGNAAPGSQMEKASLLKNQEMMRTIGSGGELAGGNIYKGSILLGPNDLPITKPPPAPPPLSMTEKLVQTVKGIPGMETAGKIMRNPLMKGAGELGALWEGGENSVRLYNHLKNSEYGRSLLDAAGLLSNAAMLAPLPTSPESNIIGGALSIPIGYLQGKLDESDLPKKKAGGLMSLAEGRQPGKPDESLVPQVTLEGDYNYRPDLDPEVSLEQTIKDMYNSPANSLSPILHPESVIKGLGSAGESLGRGVGAAIPGVFGDFESLGRSGLNYIGTGRDVNNDVQYDELGNPISNNTSYGESTNLVNPHTALPTTEDYLKMLPRATPKFGDDTANSFLEGLGGFLSPLAFEKASPYALKGAKALGQTAAEKMMSGEPWIKGAEFLNPTVLNAVKPKGGNNPMSLGSTLPLEEQGEMGKFLSLSMMDPIQIFETRLKTHFGNDRAQNNKLREAWKEHVERRLNEHSDDVAYGIRNENIDKVKKEAGEEFAQALEKSRLSENDPNIKKLLSPSEIENIVPHYQSWVNGPLKNYITKQMGTGLETDPLLKVINDSDIMPHEIFGTTDRSATDHIINEAKDRRDQFVREYTQQNGYGVQYGNPPSLPIDLENTSIGKKTATTPAGQHYEDLIDRTMYPRGKYAFKAEEGFPGVKFLNNQDVIPDFLNQPGEHIGFEAIQNKVIDNLLTGKTPIEKILNQHPSVVVQDMIKEKVAEMKALQKSTEAYHGWRQENHNALPTDTRFTDAEGNPTNKKLVIFDEKMANENPDLLTRNIAQETKDLNHCVGACGMNNNKYTPMVAPHTGVANKTDSTHGPDYLRRIKNGEISIASLRGPNGESKATLELNRINNKEAPTIRLVQVANGEPKYEVKHGWDSPNKIKYFDTEQEANKYIYDYITVPNQFRIGQLKGKDNSKVIGDEYINDAKNWLNHKHQTGELSNQPFDDIKNLPGVYDLKNEGNDNFGKLSRSSDSKDNAAFDAYLQFAQNKIQNDPKLLAKYNSGHLSFSEIMDPYLPRFVTADDLINLLTPK